MKIYYIKMKNYRQYRDATVEFSTDLQKKVTIIQGNNGTGKSNLLNAITWCLYGEERHIREEDRGLPFVNEKVYHTLPVGHIATVEVELALGREEIEYRINRKAEIARQFDGEIAVRQDSDPEVMYRVRGDWRRSPQPAYAINSLLPAEISHFFFFDGEQLDKFFESNSPKRVQTGVINVSQIDLLDRAINHLQEVQKQLRRRANYIDPKINKTNKKIEQYEKEVSAHRTQLKALQEEHQGLEDNLEKTRQQLRHSNIEEVRTLQEQRDNYENKGERYDGQLSQLRSKAAAGLRQVGPGVYAHTALQQALKLLKEQEVKGELPPKVRRPFFQDLLEREKCICGQDLHADTHARENVIRQMNAITTTDEEINGWIDGRYKLDAILQQIPQQVAQQKELGQQIRNVEESIKQLKRQLREISVKYGDVNIEEVEVLEQHRNDYQAALQETNQRIGREKGEIDRLNKGLDKSQKDLRRALEADKRQKDLLTRVELANNAYNVLREIRKELLSEVREQIEKKTEEYFRRLIWKKDTYERVEIDENYQVSVLNVRGFSSLGTLSAGEQQVLALSFMAALGTVSGFDAPIVIDTPIGRISGEPRNNIAESLPNYVDAQLILLMTDTEYTPEVKSRLKAQIGKEYRLNYLESEARTKVTPS